MCVFVCVCVFVLCLFMYKQECGEFVLVHFLLMSKVSLLVCVYAQYVNVYLRVL